MIAELFDAMLDAGFTPPSYAQAGDVVRFNVGEGKQNKNGWLLIFMDGKGAVFGDWCTDSKFTWFEKGVVENAPETIKQRNEAMQRARDEQEQRYKDAAVEARRIYNDAITCDTHGYLKRKGVGACDGLRVGDDGRLIVPVYDKNENLQSLQYIDGDGNKRFLSGGRMKGGCFVIGELERGKKAFLCEGLATGLTIREATSEPVIVAFNAGNLKTVHDNFKDDIVIVVAADNDTHGKGEKAAKECGCEYVIPPTFGDFNDLGVEKTRELLTGKAKKPFLITIEELLTDIKPINWIMKGILEKGAVGLVLGESGAGKSLFVLDWVCCLANGHDWNGFKVREPKKVVYICGEGGRGIGSRVQAIKQKYKTRIKNNAYFSTTSIDLLNAQSKSKITDAITELGVVPDLLVFDTLHKSMTGDENSAKDIAVLFAAIAELQDLYDCTVIIVHHSGLADKMRARGSSSIKAGVDFEFLITKNSDFELSIQCNKMKDYKKTTPMKFVITPTELEGDQWIDDEGERATSVFLAYNGVDAEKEKKLCDRDKLALDALSIALKDHGKRNKDDFFVIGNEGVLMVHIEEYRKYFNTTCKGKNKTRDFDLSLDSLKNRRYIDRDGSYIWVIEE